MALQGVKNKLSGFIREAHVRARVAAWLSRTQDQIAIRKSRTSIAICALLGLEFVYGAAVKLRALAWHFEKLLKSRKIDSFKDIPVICVGNATWGGTGKTPCVQALIQMYAETHSSKNESRLSKRPLIVASRGAAEDELSQIAAFAAKLDVRILFAVGQQRHREIDKVCAQLLRREGTRPAFIILDDGLQHMRIRIDRAVLMIDSTKPLGTNGRLLPAGSLREPFRMALRRAHVVILHNANLVTGRKLAILRRFVRRELHFAAPGSGSVRIISSSARPRALFHATSDALHNIPFHLLSTTPRLCTLCAIGNPAAFEALVRCLSAESARSHSGARRQSVPTICAHFRFVDHHRFTIAELTHARDRAHKLGATAIITTEKDWYRDRALMRQVFCDAPPEEQRKTPQLWILSIQLVPHEPDALASVMFERPGSLQVKI